MGDLRRQTFANIPDINFGLDILLLAAEAAKNTVIVTSVFGELYSIDGGKTWGHSFGGGLSQSIRYIGAISEGDGLHFGIAGAHGGKQGVAITNNAGITFKAYPAPALYTDARYAVYPNDKTWYIAGGSFPTNPPPPPPPGAAPVTVPRKFERRAPGGVWDSDLLSPPADRDGTYQAQIVKTTVGAPLLRAAPDGTSHPHAHAGWRRDVDLDVRAELDLLLQRD